MASPCSSSAAAPVGGRQSSETTFRIDPLRGQSAKGSTEYSHWLDQPFDIRGGATYPHFMEDLVPPLAGHLYQVLTGPNSRMHGHARPRGVLPVETGVGMIDASTGCAH